MSTLKKVLALTLALAMVMSLGVFAAFNDQKDIDEDCTGAMELMNALGILKGDNHGNANPTANITRAEAAAMIFRLMNKGKIDASIYNGMKIFSDVPAGIWFEGYVNYCFTMGIISGRTATTFDPQAPVTGMEIAKMLLGCCGYNADKQGYKGADWARNVQNDAFSAGMIDNFGMALTVPAQRQWVAVMFDDALNCKMVKTYLGETVEIEDTLGEKKFDYKVTVGVVNAVAEAKLTGSAANENYTVVGTTQFKKVVSNDLLGQEVRVYHKDGDNDKVYAITTTSKNKVGTAVLCDVKESSGKYTVGTLTGELESDAILVYNDATAGLKAYTNADAFKAVVGKNSTAAVKAIDNDKDGKINVVVVTNSQYGTYIVNALSKGSLLGVAFEKADMEDFNFVNTVASKDFVKVTYNVFTGKKDIEKLTAVSGMLNSAVDGVYTISGTKYEASVDAVAGLNTYLTNADLRQKMDFYTDGKFMVSAANVDTAVITMPTNLVLLTAKGTKTDNTYGTEVTTNLVKVLGLDGKITEYVCANKVATTEDVNEWGDLKVDTVYQYTVDEASGKMTLKVVVLPGNVLAANKTEASSLNVARDTLNSMVVAADAKLFVKYDTTKYAVMSIGDFTKTQNVASYNVYTKSVSGLNTVIGGFVSFNTAPIEDGTTAVGKYVIATANSFESSDETYYYQYLPVMNMDGTEETLMIKKDKASVGTGTYKADMMYEVSDIDANGCATVVECFKTTTNNDKIVVTEVKGASGTMVQLEGQGLVTLDKDCAVIVKTMKAGGSAPKSITANGNVADLYAQTGAVEDGFVYKTIKAFALEDVSGGVDFAAKNVSLLYVVVELN